MSVYKHLVIWKLTEKSRAPRVVEEAKNVLEELRRNSPGLLKIELASTVGEDETSGDLVLYSEFSSMDAYQQYDRSSAHLQLKKIIGPHRQHRMGADYLCLDNG